jgi:hypothetical protein
MSKSSFFTSHRGLIKINTLSPQINPEARRGYFHLTFFNYSILKMLFLHSGLHPENEEKPELKVRAPFGQF